MRSLLPHLFFLYITLVTPWLGRLKYLKLKEQLAGGVPKAKVNAYRKGLIAQALRVGLVVAVIYADPSFTTIVTALRSSLDGTTRGALAVFTLGTGLSAIWFRYHGSRQFERLRKTAGAVLPWTTAEYAWFAAIGIGAGISEELVFRGFLFCYLAKFFPRLDAYGILVASSLLFGLNHIYQGYRGVIGTAIIGLALGMLYYTSGGLIAPIVVHALIDLRIILILTPQRMQMLARDAAPA
jgi:membrane protease YdiL (CAAX protease family)